MIQLKENIYWVGTNDWEARGFHGDELTTHKGTTYNAYLIKDEKNVLIDAVAENMTELFLEKLNKVIEFNEIDYIVINHSEPDHSGSLVELMKLCPNAQIIASEIGKETIKKHYHEEWDIRTVKTGDTLDIGTNELMFIEARMLHWPDTMFTYLKGENILFSNDAFGQHYASSKIFNDKCSGSVIMHEALKYYANILAPFNKLVINKLDEIEKLGIKIEMIAPSHGIIWRKNPEQIIKKYYEWSENKLKDNVVIVYGSMYGSTKRMAEHIGLGLESIGLRYRIYNIKNTDMSDLLTEIYSSKGVLFGSPTINNGSLVSLHPLLKEMKALRYLNKKGATFGSYGWSGEATKELVVELEDAKVEIIEESINTQYSPTKEDIKKCYNFGRDFGEKILSSN